jgi:hypothetical protein
MALEIHLTVLFLESKPAGRSPEALFSIADASVSMIQSIVYSEEREFVLLVIPFYNSIKQLHLQTFQAPTFAAINKITFHHFKHYFFKKKLFNITKTNISNQPASKNAVYHRSHAPSLLLRPHHC